ERCARAVNQRRPRPPGRLRSPRAGPFCVRPRARYASGAFLQPPPTMDATIAALPTQDGITNGAIYALLALALVLVFTVTRVIWVPSGEFVAYGTLTLAGLQLGKPPGTVSLVAGMAIVAGAMEVYDCVCRGEAR